MLRRGGRLSLSKRRALLILPIWIISLIWVWSWWFAPGRVDLLWLYIPLSAALLYEFAFLPSAFLLFVILAKTPPRRRILKNQKVAVITPCVPAQESMEVIERQLKAMSEITYPHDSWILDEGDSKKIKKLAKKYGVKHFSRKGLAKYNRDDYPFKTKTKAGNVNAWLDRVKRRKYDFFVQLDVDHAPKPNYLDKTLRYFRDPEVGWVQPPSVYSNLDSWVARGAAEQDFAFQGPLQMGFYGFGDMPMIVGSHCAYRMSAIRGIGGFQPTRAEDHLDTVVLASKGWKGVFLPEVIAEGDGPETFSVFLAQQFAWSYSMFQILLHFSPKYLPRIRPRRKIFPLIFSETFYPLWSLSYAIMFFAPIIALSINHNIVNVEWKDFFIHLVPASLATLLIWFAGRPLMQPKGLRLSWRGIILQTIRWPIVFAAILNALFNIKKPYMITPKGQKIKTAPPAKLYIPFVLLGLISAMATILASLVFSNHLTSGQVVFTLFNTALMATICLLDLNISMRMQIGKMRNITVEWLRPAALVMILLIVFSLAITTSPMVQKSAVLALSKPSSTTARIDPNILPVSMLTEPEVIKQIESKVEPINTPAPNVGIHDPIHSFDSGAPYIRHSFIDWRNSNELADEILKSERLGAVPLITVEPDGVENGKALLEGIADGQYDSTLLDLARVLHSAKAPVYIRFAHEMDLSNLYPWGAQNPQLFVKAYRHTVKYIKAQDTPYVKWVWSPAGNNGTQAYYPGGDVTDIVGTTILYDRYWSGNFQPTFEQLSSIRVWLEGYGKPVWITEFGIGNYDPSYQARLLGDAVAHFKEYGFSALVYLNIDDANLKIPDYIFSNAKTVSKILGINKPRTTTIIAASEPQHTEKAKNTVVLVAKKINKQVWDCGLSSNESTYAQLNDVSFALNLGPCKQKVVSTTVLVKKINRPISNNGKYVVLPAKNDSLQLMLRQLPKAVPAKPSQPRPTPLREGVFAHLYDCVDGFGQTAYSNAPHLDLTMGACQKTGILRPSVNKVNGFKRHEGYSARLFTTPTDPNHQDMDQLIDNIGQF